MSRSEDANGVFRSGGVSLVDEGRLTLPESLD
jgi:hypothetical protein